MSRIFLCPWENFPLKLVKSSWVRIFVYRYMRRRGMERAGKASHPRRLSRRFPIDLSRTLIAPDFNRLCLRNCQRSIIIFHDCGSKLLFVGQIRNVAFCEPTFEFISRMNDFDRRLFDFGVSCKEDTWDACQPTDHPLWGAHGAPHGTEGRLVRLQALRRLHRDERQHPLCVVPVLVFRQVWRLERF